MPLSRNPFNGTLRPNEVLSAIFNMILSQRVMYPDTANNYNFLDTFKEEGGMYGDQKLFYDSDVLHSRKWLGDAEASNLLNVNRPASPKCQSIPIGTLRVVDITVDNYLSKRAWGDEGAFTQFNSMIVGQVATAKEIHETTALNAFIGTTEVSSAVISAPVSTATTGLSGEEKSRVAGQTIAQTIADTFTEALDYSRKFNSYGFLRAYPKNKLHVIFNSAYKNKIIKTDYPTTFSNDGLIDFGKELPARYFGTAVDNTVWNSLYAATATTGKPIQGNANSGTYVPGTNNANGKLISRVEKTVVVSGTTYHILPGDELPAGVALSKAYSADPNTFMVSVASSSTDIGNAVDCEFAVADDKVICKIVSDDTYKMLSAFTVGTEFFNPASLTQNHYLIWGYGLDYLRGQPVITIKEA